MRQLLMNMNGVVVARMPRPSVQPGHVLIRVRYSLVSVGTEIAPLKATSAPAPDAPTIERIEHNLNRIRQLRHYARASIRDPRKAATRLMQMAERRLARAHEAAVVPPPAAAPAGEPTAAVPASPPPSDINAQGWAIGYSVAGEVVTVGDGVVDLAAGDLVAAAGAGQANHA